MAEPAGYDAIVLAGGMARRLGGADKPGAQVAGVTLLDLVLEAVADAARIVVVGPARPTTRPVTWVREEPAGTGPAAAAVAALPLLSSPAVALLAADLPLLTAKVMAGLREAATGQDGAILVDAQGREQWLTGMWATAVLRAAAPAVSPGASLRDLLGGLQAERVPLAAVGLTEWFDCDTEDDLRRARERR